MEKEIFLASFKSLKKGFGYPLVLVRGTDPQQGIPNTAGSEALSESPLSDSVCRVYLMVQWKGLSGRRTPLTKMWMRCSPSMRGRQITRTCPPAGSPTFVHTFTHTAVNQSMPCFKGSRQRESRGVGNVSNCPNLSRTVAIDVLFFINFAVVFDFKYFRFRPSKAK
jgi:hypothetical protein